VEAETEATYCYRLDSGRQLQITMHIRLRTPGDPDAHVSTALLCGHTWSEELMEVLASQIYRGVHGGLGVVAHPLPAGNLHIEVLKLDATPPLSELARNSGIRLPVDIIEVLVRDNVASLWYGVAPLVGR
jgi:hypothetical protein